MDESRKTVAAGVGKRFAALALSAVLACGLVPGLALADLGAGSMGQQATKSAEAGKAATETVYVLVKSKEVAKSNGGYVSTTVSQYSVDAKTGLLKKRVDSTKSSESSFTIENTTKWGYDKNRNLKTRLFTNDSYGTKVTRKFKTTNAGVLKKDAQTTDLNNYKTTYTAKSGKIVKAVRSYDSEQGSITFKMKYKGGKVVEISNSRSALPYAYKYDKKGNIAKMATYKGGTKVVINHKNKYDKKGNLVKRTTKVGGENGSTTTATFKFKAIKVPKALAKKVKAQQWAIQNNDLNFALGNW